MSSLCQREWHWHWYCEMLRGVSWLFLFVSISSASRRVHWYFGSCATACPGQSIKCFYSRQWFCRHIKWNKSISPRRFSGENSSFVGNGEYSEAGYCAGNCSGVGHWTWSVNQNENAMVVCLLISGCGTSNAQQSALQRRQWYSIRHDHDTVDRWPFARFLPISLPAPHFDANKKPNKSSNMISFPIKLFISAKPA